MRARVTKIFCFEMAHALFGHDGPCRNIHGHSYRLSVTVTGEVNAKGSGSKTGMVIDFTDLKSIVDQHIVKKYDHAMVLSEEHADVLRPEAKPGLENMITVPYQPTCENLVSAFAATINSRLPDGVKLHHLKLRETPTSYAEWYAEDNR